jgi:hypothetical protein
MPNPNRIFDSDVLLADFEDHSESIYLGPWTELTVGNLRLVRRDDGMIEAQEIVEECAAL